MSPKTNSKLVVLSAPSGTGKSTLAGMLRKKHPELAISISYTTRLARGVEKHGEHYFFISEAEFQDMVQKKAFLEYAHVFGKNWYGTAKKTIEDFLNAGRSVVFDIDVEGARNLKSIYKERCCTIFILPPSMQELEQRLRGRKTESDQAIATRLKTAKQEMTQANAFDYQITNKDLDASVALLEDILVKEGCL